jgi:hypothetical protein
MCVSWLGKRQSLAATQVTANELSKRPRECTSDQQLQSPEISVDGWLNRLFHLDHFWITWRTVQDRFDLRGDADPLQFSSCIPSSMPDGMQALPFET